MNPLTDAILGATILIHSHIGFQACIIDYFPGYRTPKVQNALMWVLRVATILTGIGFYEFETSMCSPRWFLNLDIKLLTIVAQTMLA